MTQMRQHEELTVDFFKDAFGALSRGDLSVFRSMFHHDVEWHLPGDPKKNPHVGIYQGDDEVTAFLQGLIDASGGTLEMPVHDVLTHGYFRGGLNGRHSVVLARSEARRGAKALSSSDVIVFHIREDSRYAAERLGLICWFPEDQYGADDFWAA
ncbi:MAG: nuclear transport factor 2 family protein [Micromonosporaceae bacterium]